MHLFLVKFNRCGYDQYDAFVVAAESPDAAIDVIDDARGDPIWNDNPKPLPIAWHGGYTVELIEPSEPGIILGSFKAG